MMKYHFFLAPATMQRDDSSHKRKKMRGRGAPCEMSLLEWGGESPPRDENFLRGGGGRLGHSVLCPRACVRATGGTPKNPTFPENPVFVFTVQLHKVLRFAKQACQ